PSDEVGRAGEPQSVLVDPGNLRGREALRPDLDLLELRDVCRKQRPDCTAADDADSHAPSAHAQRAHVREQSPDMSEKLRRAKRTSRSAPGLVPAVPASGGHGGGLSPDLVDRKSTRLNSSHQIISYAVLCL